MYYRGIGPEQGRTVEQEDAFAYACDRCLSGTDEEQVTFMEMAMATETMEDFASGLVEWSYSGNWIPVREETPYECAV